MRLDKPMHEDEEHILYFLDVPDTDGVVFGRTRNLKARLQTYPKGTTVLDTRLGPRWEIGQMEKDLKRLLRIYPALHQRAGLKRTETIRRLQHDEPSIG